MSQIENHSTGIESAHIDDVGAAGVKSSYGMPPALRPTPQQSVIEQGGVAVVLALVAGYIDAYVFLNYNVYASFMSGNTTQTGLKLGQQQLNAAVHNLLPIICFIAGVFLGTLLLYSPWQQPQRWLFGVVAALLAVSGALGMLAPWPSIAMLSLAMGVMNTSVTRVGEQPISLGYVTGSLNNLAQHLALAIKHKPVPLAQGPWDTHQRRALILATVWVGFLCGALLAGVATPHFAVMTLLVPCVILMLLATFHRNSRTVAS